MVAACLTHGLIRFILFIVLSFAGSSMPPLSMENSDQKKLENFLQYPVQIEGVQPKFMSLSDRMAYYKVPGVSIAIIDRGHIVLACGYGVSQSGLMLGINEDTLFQGASISKMVTTFGALLLVKQGKVDLDNEINFYLKRWTVPKRNPYQEDKLTLRQLLSHTGGISVSSVFGYWKDEPMPDYIEFLNGIKPISKSDPVEVVSKPGERFEYSGGGLTIVELMIEAVTGLSFKEYMQKAVFDPLNMSRSLFAHTLSDNEKNYAAVHMANGEPYPGLYMKSPVLAASALWTTPKDLAMLGINLQKSLLGDIEGLLSFKLANEMITPQIGKVGLGCFINKEQNSFGHNGVGNGRQTSLLLTRDGQRGLIIMTNSDNGAELYSEIKESIYTVYQWPKTQMNEKCFAPLKNELLNIYAGEYGIKSNSENAQEIIFKSLILAEKNGKLYVSWLRYVNRESSGIYRLTPKMPLYSETESNFFARSGNPDMMKFSFTTDGQLKIGNKTYIKYSKLFS